MISHDRPIAAHALLSDRHGTALLDDAGGVVWWCSPRPDSAPVFAALLGADAGHLRAAPVGGGTATRRYLGRTLAVETTWTTGTGTLVTVDALASGPGRGHDLGGGAPGMLVRRLTCTRGSVEVALSCAPRPEMGLVHPLLSPVQGGVQARGGAERLVLSCPAALQLDGATATGTLRLAEGEELLLGLDRSSLGDATPARVWSQQELAAELEGTVEAWESWSQLHQSYDGPWAELVHTSGRVLQGLSYLPTGAIVAAATTSLPEEAGGERNWDYRYTWVRDASLTMEALWVAACPDEAADFFGFLATAAAGSVGRGQALQIMFGVGGERDLSERSIEHLPGWRGSRPVRVGNGAWQQQQVNVYGELLGAAVRLREQLADADSETRAFLVACADAAAIRWRETDQGIWEVRGPARHFTHSKVMCWVALDRAIALAGLLDADERVPDWERAREEVKQEVLAHGWSEAAGAFTQSFGSTDLDASVLLLPVVGFLPVGDPRLRATVDAVAQRLTDERGLVYRYRGESGDGLAGEEGAFLLCTFWLAQAQALVGEVEAARATMERAVGFANDLGLLAEEVDARTGELLGNFPQAFSHIGLVNAAWAIRQAEQAQVEKPSAGQGAPA